MAERQVVVDESVEPVMDQQGQALQNAVERAERAEAELAKLKTKPSQQGVFAGSVRSSAGAAAGHIA